MKKTIVKFISASVMFGAFLIALYTVATTLQVVAKIEKASLAFEGQAADFIFSQMIIGFGIIILLGLIIWATYKLQEDYIKELQFNECIEIPHQCDYCDDIAVAEFEEPGCPNVFMCMNHAAEVDFNESRNLDGYYHQ